MENNTPKTENNQPQGWKDVQIVPDMPLNALLGFLNVLNQRLCTLEDLTLVDGPAGKKITLTEAYAIQAEEVKAQYEAELAKQQAEKGE